MFFVIHMRLVMSYAFGYVLSVWAGCNNMFFVIHMRLVMS